MTKTKGRPRGRNVVPPTAAELVTRRWSLGHSIAEIHHDLPDLPIETARKVVADPNRQVLAWMIGSEDEVDEQACDTGRLGLDQGNF